METKLMEITPEMAAKFLKKNTKNRNKSGTHIKYLADQMKSGEWKLSPQPIVFNGDTLIDGQHRLEAVIASGKPQQFMVVTGADAKVIDIIDTGKTRTGGDVLSMNGFENGIALSSAIKFLLLYEKRGVVSNRYGGANRINITNSKILTYAKKHPELNEQVQDALEYHKAFKLIGKALTSGMYCVLRSKHEEALVNKFFDALYFGIGTSKNHPAMIFRNAISNNETSVRKYTALTRAALFIKCWNAFVDGSDISVLRWKQGKENFPPIR